MQITGIILAGGKSTRMGTDKALLKIEGETLLNRAVKLCQSVCNQIIISSYSADHDVEGIIRIQDEIENCGPMGGIYSCLKHASNDWSFIISVDAAFVTPEFVHFLAENRSSFNAVVPMHERGKEPLIAMYHKNCAESLKMGLESGNFKMYNLLENLDVNFVDAKRWKDQNPGLFHNINSPEDLTPE